MSRTCSENTIHHPHCCAFLLLFSGCGGHRDGTMTLIKNCSRQRITDGVNNVLMKASLLKCLIKGRKDSPPWGGWCPILARGNVGETSRSSGFIYLLSNCTAFFWPNKGQYRPEFLNLVVNLIWTPYFKLQVFHFLLGYEQDTWNLISKNNYFATILLLPSICDAHSIFNGGEASPSVL